MLPGKYVVSQLFVKPVVVPVEVDPDVDPVEVAPDVVPDELPVVVPVFTTPGLVVMPVDVPVLEPVVVPVLVAITALSHGHVSKTFRMHRCPSDLHQEYPWRHVRNPVSWGLLHDLSIATQR